MQQSWTEFEARFLRCYGVLYFLALRILGSSAGVEDVIENCRVRASQSSVEFGQEGAFRSWLVRVLIDEALGVLRKKRASTVNASES